MPAARTFATRSLVSIVLAIGALVIASSAKSGADAPRWAAASFTARAFATGADLSHVTPKGAEAISQPDDITSLGPIFSSASRTASVRRASQPDGQPRQHDRGVQPQWPRRRPVGRSSASATA